MFCSNCGNTVNENAVCPCANVSVESGQTKDTEAQNVLPQSQAVIVNAAKIAADIKKNPYVVEIMAAAKGMLSRNAVSVVADAGKRTDILWMILVPFTALISTVSIFYGLFGWLVKTINSISSGFWRGGGKLKIGDILSGLDMLKVHFSIFSSLLISFFVFSGLLFLLMIVWKRKTSFYSICNMLAHAFLPATVLTFMAFIFALFLPVVSLVLILLVFTTMPILIYSGVNILSEFEKPPFWFVCVYYAVALSASVYIVSKFVFGTISSLSDIGLDRLLFSLF